MLVVGLTGLTAELIKNIVLAGIKSLTLIDHRNGDETTVNAIQGSTFLLLPSERNENTPVNCTATICDQALPCSYINVTLILL